MLRVSIPLAFGEEKNRGWGGSPGTGAALWLPPHRSSGSGCASVGFAGCSHGRRADVILMGLLPAGTAPASALPSVAVGGEEAAAWVVSQRQKAPGFAFLRIEYA